MDEPISKTFDKDGTLAEIVTGYEQHVLNKQLSNPEQYRPNTFSNGSKFGVWDWHTIDVYVLRGFNKSTPFVSWVASQEQLVFDLSKSQTVPMILERETVDDSDVLLSEEIKSKTTNHILSLPIHSHEFVDNPLEHAEQFGKQFEQRVLKAIVDHSKAIKQYARANRLEKEETFSLVRHLVSILSSRKYYGPYIALCGKSFAENDNINAIRKAINRDDPSIAAHCMNAFQVSENILPANEIVLFQATTNVFRLVYGGGPITIQVDELARDNKPVFKILAMIEPQIRENYYGNVGIVRCKFSLQSNQKEIDAKETTV